MKFFKGDHGLQWYYSEYGEAYRPTIDPDLNGHNCCQGLFENVYMVKVYEPREVSKKRKHGKMSHDGKKKPLAELIKLALETNPKTEDPVA